MATAPATVLNSAQREWLKNIGVALDVKATGASSAATPTAEAPATSSSVRADAPKGDSNSPPNPSVVGKPILKQGSNGQDVKDLQTLLNKHGTTLKVDGDFGKLTTDAVKEFQKTNPPLKVDGVVGTQTWTALAASKPEPQKPPDVGPRVAVFLVTDAANNAVKGAVVKLGELTEKTGNTGQATISIPPGSHPFGVTADGFEQAIGTFEVTIDKESQKRVELKRVEGGTKVVLTVQPSGKSNKHDKLDLKATVTVAGGGMPPPGVIQFVVNLHGSTRHPLTPQRPLTGNEASHIENLLPKGTHQLFAVYSPTPPVQGISETRSAEITHIVDQDEKGEDKDVAKRIISKLDDNDAAGIEQEVKKFQNPPMRRILNVMLALENAGKLEAFLEHIDFDKPDRDRLLVAMVTILRKFTRDWFKKFSKLKESDQKAVLARVPEKVKRDFDLQDAQSDPPNPDDKNDRPSEVPPDINILAKLEFHSPAFAEILSTEMALVLRPNGKLKGAEVDVALAKVKQKLKTQSQLGSEIELEAKLSLNAEVELNEPDTKFVIKHIHTAIKGEIQFQLPEIKVLKNVIFTLTIKVEKTCEVIVEGQVRFHF